MPYSKFTIAERLERLSMPEPNSGCVLWCGSVDGKGYGYLRTNGRRGPRPLAHRLAWEAKNGPFPEGKIAMHKCDVRSCINPDHIVPGSYRDNTADMIAKGRAGFHWARNAT